MVHLDSEDKAHGVTRLLWFVDRRYKLLSALLTCVTNGKPLIPDTVSITPNARRRNPCGCHGSRVSAMQPGSHAWEQVMQRVGSESPCCVSNTVLQRRHGMNASRLGQRQVRLQSAQNVTASMWRKLARCICSHSMRSWN